MRAALRRGARGGRGKIRALRGEAERYELVAAECLLAAFGTDPGDAEDPRYIAAHAGAILLARGLNELTVLRKAWTTEE